MIDKIDDVTVLSDGSVKHNILRVALKKKEKG